MTLPFLIGLTWWLQRNSQKGKESSEVVCFHSVVKACFNCRHILAGKLMQNRTVIVKEGYSK